MSPALPLVPAAARPPRLGVDFHVWDNLFQGSRSHLLGMYSAAIRQAPDIEFVFFLNDPASLRNAHPEFALPNVTLVKMARWPAPLRLALQLPALQWRHRIDLLHMQYRLPLLRFGACACTIHDVLFESHPQFFPRSFIWQSRWSYRQAARHAALLMTVSDYSRREMARHLGVPVSRIALTPNAVDATRFHADRQQGADAVRHHGLTPGGYLLTVGRLEPRKNQALLIEAYARLGPQAPPLAIVGQRDFQYGAVFEAIERLALGSRVRLIETVDDAQLPALMRHALLFAYPSVAEGFGMPVLEAMASGVPVLASHSTALPEVASDAAELLPPESVDAWATALQRLIDDPLRRAALVSAGLARAQSFRWEDAAAVLLDNARALFSTSPPGTRHVAI